MTPHTDGHHGSSLRAISARFPCIVVLLVYAAVGLQAQELISSAELRTIEQERVVQSAEKYLRESPVTVTAAHAERSAGGVHDYYSEGTYWWPNPADPKGAYIRKDGLSNPANFGAHKDALQRFAIQTAALTAAFRLTGDRRYAAKAAEHLHAWFVDERTKMNPHLLYSQAIKGIVTGRGIGIIDATHLIEVARSIVVLEEMHALEAREAGVMREWFRAFLTWMTTHPYGIDERGNGNNHSVWWTAQVAMYATLVGDTAQQDFCRRFYRDSLLATQMTVEGTFPEELKRTRPYNYSLFTLEGMAAICQILSRDSSSVWNLATADGRTIRCAYAFLVPFIADKSKWPYQKDVAHFDELPVRMQSLLFAGLVWKSEEYLDIWKKLNADYSDEELVRTYPLRQPVLWVK